MYKFDKISKIVCRKNILVTLLSFIIIIISIRKIMISCANEIYFDLIVFNLDNIIILT